MCFRSLWHALFLLCALALAQQGHLRHELSHHGLPTPQGESSKGTAAVEPCELCLVFAPVASGAAPTPPALALQAHSAFESAPWALAQAGAAERLAQRNRDPPVSA